MPRSTSRKAPDGVRHYEFTSGDGAAQVPMAGLLAHDPELREAKLGPEAWGKKLQEYAATPRPPHPDSE